MKGFENPKPWDLEFRDLGVQGFRIYLSRLRVADYRITHRSGWGPNKGVTGLYRGIFIFIYSKRDRAREREREREGLACASSHRIGTALEFGVWGQDVGASKKDRLQKRVVFSLHCVQVCFRGILRDDSLVVCAGHYI